MTEFKPSWCAALFSMALVLGCANSAPPAAVPAVEPASDLSEFAKFITQHSWCGTLSNGLDGGFMFGTDLSLRAKGANGSVVAPLYAGNLAWREAGLGIQVLIDGQVTSKLAFALAADDRDLLFRGELGGATGVTLTECSATELARFGFRD